MNATSSFCARIAAMRSTAITRTSVLTRERKHDASQLHRHNHALASGKAVLFEPFAAHADHRDTAAVVGQRTWSFDVLDDLQTFRGWDRLRHSWPPHESSVKLKSL